MSPTNNLGLSAATLHPLLQHESLYGRWTSHCLLHGLSRAEVDLDGPLLHTSVLETRGSVPRLDAVLTRMLGIDDACLGRLRGHGVFFPSGARPAHFVKHLRFCPWCLEFGFHSMCYQFEGIYACPLHSVALRENCPVCKARFTPTVGTCIERPFECNECDHPLASSLPSAHCREDAIFADQMIGHRRPEIYGAASFGEVTGGEPLHPGAPIGARRSKQVQRATVWGARGSPQWFAFREEVMVIAPRHTRGNLGPSDRMDASTAAARTLNWLRTACGEHEQVARRLAMRLGRSPQGLRLNSHASVIGAALYRVAACYDLVQELVHMIDHVPALADGASVIAFGKSVPRLGVTDPKLPELGYRLLQLEMLGLFAVTVASMRSRSPLAQISWQSLPNIAQVVPTWQYCAGDSRTLVRIRHRATRESVARLIKRRWFDQLLYLRPAPSQHDRWNWVDFVCQEREGNRDAAEPISKNWRGRVPGASQSAPTSAERPHHG